MHLRKLILPVLLLLSLNIPAFTENVEQELLNFLTPPVETVTDLTANTLSKKEQSALKETIDRIQEENDIEIVVVIVHSTGQESIESFSLRNANAWGIGDPKKRNGILITVAKKDRRIRIEVGKGIRSRLTNKRTRSVIDQVITPSFKKGEFGVGLQRGVEAIGEMAASSTSPYIWFLLYIPMILLIELFKRIVKNRWLIMGLGFLGYLGIGCIAVEVGASIGLAFILFMVSFLVFKFPRYRYVIRRLQKTTPGKEPVSTNFLFSGLGIGIATESFYSHTGGHSSSGNFGSGSGFTGGGGSFGAGGGGSFGGDGASGGW